MEYNGIVKSQHINGEVKVIVDADGLTMMTMFDAFHLPYVEIIAFTVRDYTVHIEAESGAYDISGLGFGCEPFFDELYAAFNSKVSKALFVSGTPLLKTKGEYIYCEDGQAAQGRAVIEIYDNCVLLLPADIGARRIPLCFVSNMEAKPFEITLNMDTGNSYTFSKLGYDTEAFKDTLNKQLRALRQKTLDFVKTLDPSLTSIQVFGIAKLMFEGISASIGDIGSIAPSFILALENKIGESRASKSYAVLKSICDPAQIHIGIKRSFGERNSESEEDTEDAESMMIWIIAPGKNGFTAAVEFAVAEDESAATFLYQYKKDFKALVNTFNRSLEVIDFRREVIWINDTELQKPENSGYIMAIKRNKALLLIRECFSGRIIHSSLEKWKQEMLNGMN